MSPVPEHNRQDPHNPSDDELSSTPMDAVIIEAGSSEGSSDEEMEGHMGYQLLPQDVNHMPEDNDGDSDEELEASASAGTAEGSGANPLDSAIRGVMDGEDFTTACAPSNDQESVLTEEAERKQIWNQPRPQGDFAHLMDDEHMNKIKSAMAGIKIPGIQIPAWARIIPEEQWKTNLLSQLQDQSHSEVHSETGQSLENVPGKCVKQVTETEVESGDTSSDMETEPYVRISDEETSKDNR